METIRGKTTREIQQITGRMTEELKGMGGTLTARRQALVPSYLGDLGDVEIMFPKTGEVLVFDGEKWVNKEDEGGVIKTVDEQYLNISGENLSLSESVKNNLNNFGADNKLIDNALSTNVTNKLANFDGNNKLKDSALSKNVTDRLGELDELTEKLSNNEDNGFIQNKNLLYGLEKGGFTAQGQLADSNIALRTGFMPIVPNEKYVFSVNNVSGYDIEIFPYYYDSNYGFVGSGNWQSSGNRVVTTTISSAKYVKLKIGDREDKAMDLTKVSNVQFEKGEVATSYVE